MSDNYTFIISVKSLMMVLFIISTEILNDAYKTLDVFHIVIYPIQ